MASLAMRRSVTMEEQVAVPLGTIRGIESERKALFFFKKTQALVEPPIVMTASRERVFFFVGRWWEEDERIQKTRSLVKIVCEDLTADKRVVCFLGSEMRKSQKTKVNLRSLALMMKHYSKKRKKVLHLESGY